MIGGLGHAGLWGAPWCSKQAAHCAMAQQAENSRSSRAAQRSLAL
jgi:hypothetical protein